MELFQQTRLTVRTPVKGVFFTFLMEVLFQPSDSTDKFIQSAGRRGVKSPILECRETAQNGSPGKNVEVARAISKSQPLI